MCIVLPFGPADCWVCGQREVLVCGLDFLWLVSWGGPCFAPAAPFLMRPDTCCVHFRIHFTSCPNKPATLCGGQGRRVTVARLFVVRLVLSCMPCGWARRVHPGFLCNCAISVAVCCCQHTVRLHRPSAATAMHSDPGRLSHLHITSNSRNTQLANNHADPPASVPIYESAKAAACSATAAL
jgi:hypothetical protein